MNIKPGDLVNIIGEGEEIFFVTDENGEYFEVMNCEGCGCMEPKEKCSLFEGNIKVEASYQWVRDNAKL